MPDKDVGDAGGNGRSPERLLGELIAEVRALKHSTNNNSSKLDSIGAMAETQKEMLRRLEHHDEELEKHHFRIAVLEADQHRRQGAIGLVEWVGRHWPFAFISAVLAAWVAWANGKINP